MYVEFLQNKEADVRTEEPDERPTTPSSTSDGEKSANRDQSDNEDSEVDDYNLTEDQKRALAELDNLKSELGYTGNRQKVFHSSKDTEITFWGLRVHNGALDYTQNMMTN